MAKVCSPIQMVDVSSQYIKIKEEIDAAVLEVIGTSSFINGPAVKSFTTNLEKYLDTNYVIPCGNGTDALQIALMALGLKAGDEVIVPAFTYVATAEVIALLGLTPVMVDVHIENFNITIEAIEAAITNKTVAVIPVNLFGQCAPAEKIRILCDKHNLWMIEDNAQAIGSHVNLSDGSIKKSGTIGHIGTTSFYPSKNLGAYGDGGAIYTDDEVLAEKMKRIANHGQSKRYYHDIVGCNSRLDSIQAAILDVKLKYLDSYITSRQKAADIYDYELINVDQVNTPTRNSNNSHVFHQYTIKVINGERDALKVHLESHGIPSMIYYPVPLYKQKAFKKGANTTSLENTETLCSQVLSLPIHSEMDKEQICYITSRIKAYFNK